ncbi:MAG: hypothetical protein K0R54_1522 [Clostridiaceae bacterium]|jgi:hypothetical protein|nr:hypothetical protein [Clostridiaceae bacterium]
MNTVVILEDSAEFTQSINFLINKLNLNLEVVPCSLVKNNGVYNYIIVNNNIKTKLENLNCSYCLVNVDNLSDKKINTNIYGNIITYGYGNKNTVTISSVSDEDCHLIYCLQRNLNNNSLGMLEPIEIQIQGEYHNEDEIYAAIALITISLIEGIDIDYLRKKIIEK